MKTEKELLELKERVDEAKTTVSELTGQQTALMNQLKADWKCNTIAEADAKLEEMRTKIDSLDKKIKAGIQELEEKYEV